MNALETVKAYFSALENEKPVEAFSLFADDVKWHQPGNNKFSGIKVGSKEIGDMISGMMNDTEGNFTVIPFRELMPNGNLIAVPVRFSGNKPNGKSIDMEGIDLFEVINEKITQVWLFSADQKEEDNFWGNK